MTNAIGTSQDLALQPAAAAARPQDAGTEALKKSLDADAVEGREAVQAADATAPSAPPPEPTEQPKTHHVDRVA